MSKTNLGHKQKNREEIDLLSSRIDLLQGKDKLLMTMYLENGYSFFKIAKVTGLSQASISRRINRLIKKLLKGRFLSCLRNRDKLNRYQMLIAKDYFLKGLSIREIAKKRVCTIYQMRETILDIKRILNECEDVNSK
jgi:predicted DNA-binding protein YlxM (UPF0122 family)